MATGANNKVAARNRAAFEERIIALRESPAYRWCSVSEFHKMLALNEGITVGYRTLGRILGEAGMTSERAHGAERRGFRWRTRRENPGEMVQVSAGSHDWFAGKPRCTLHIGVDDASGHLTGLWFCVCECPLGYAQVLRQTLLTHGYPQDLYSTTTGVFLMEGNASGIAGLGTFVKKELLLELIPAAGIVGGDCCEGLFRTLRAHFSAWLAEQGIADMESANSEGLDYLPVFNRKFQVRHNRRNPRWEPFSALDDFDKYVSTQFVQCGRVGCKEGFCRIGLPFRMDNQCKTPC